MSEFDERGYDNDVFPLDILVYGGLIEGAMKAFLKRIVVAFLVLTLALAQAPTRERFQLLEPGVFHGQDVSLDQPISWVGLYCKGNRCETRPTRVRSIRVPDPLGDDDPKTPTGTSIEVSTRERPLFLVRGLSSVRGSITTVFIGQRNMEAGDRQDLSLAGTSYILRVEGDKTNEDPLPKGSRLVLTNGSITQELFSLPDGGNDPYIKVLWIGDLDGDGKPDFYVDTSWHYNLSHKVLWLSSLAKPGELVGQAAVFKTVGC